MILFLAKSVKPIPTFELLERGNIHLCFIEYFINELKIFLFFTGREDSIKDDLRGQNEGIY